MSIKIETKTVHEITLQCDTETLSAISHALYQVCIAGGQMVDSNGESFALDSDRARDGVALFLEAVQESDVELTDWDEIWKDVTVTNV